MYRPRPAGGRRREDADAGVEIGRRNPQAEEFQVYPLPGGKVEGVPVRLVARQIGPQRVLERQGLRVVAVDVALLSGDDRQAVHVETPRV